MTLVSYDNVFCLHVNLQSVNGKQTAKFEDLVSPLLPSVADLIEDHDAFIPASGENAVRAWFFKEHVKDIPSIELHGGQDTTKTFDMDLSGPDQFENFRTSDEVSKLLEFMDSTYGKDSYSILFTGTVGIATLC